MKLLEITVEWYWVRLKIFGNTYSIRYVSKYQVAQVDISNDKVKFQTLRIVR